jgi:hypothetical protein
MAATDPGLDTQLFIVFSLMTVISVAGYIYEGVADGL